MIKVGKVKEAQHVTGLPIEVQEEIKELLVILDSEYGADRDVDKDLGGFVALIEVKQDFELLRQDYYLDITEQKPEWMMTIETGVGEQWLQALFVISNDYSIVLVGAKDQLSFLEEV